MTLELSKNLKCVVLRNGIELWREAVRLDNLSRQLCEMKTSNFIKMDDELINSADITGIFSAATMEELKRRKNGQWKCKWGFWHEQKMPCGHSKEDIKPKPKEIVKN